MNSPVLALSGVTKSFPQPSGELHVLRQTDLLLPPGEVVALLGASGSGKTTLLQIAGLLAGPTTGQIRLLGEDASRATEGERTRLRRDHIGFVYQFHHLMPEFTAEENVILPQLVAGQTKADAATRARSLLTELGLEARATHRPSQLSGGEQQRVAIARALANDPSLLLADEPTGNLDEQSAEIVFAKLMQVVKERNMAALIATHNIELAKRMHRIVRLEKGVLSVG